MRKLVERYPQAELAAIQADHKRLRYDMKQKQCASLEAVTAKGRLCCRSNSEHQ